MTDAPNSIEARLRRLEIADLERSARLDASRNVTLKLLAAILGGHMVGRVYIAGLTSYFKEIPIISDGSVQLEKAEMYADEYRSQTEKFIFELDQSLPEDQRTFPPR